MRLIDLMKEFNISFEVVYNYLVENGIQVRESIHQRIDEKTYKIVADKFATYRNEKIEASKVVLIENDNENDNIRKYQEVKREAFDRYNKFCVERIRLNNDVKLLNEKNQKYWALDDDEILALSNLKSQQQSKNLSNIEDIIRYFEDPDKDETILELEDFEYDELENDVEEKIHYDENFDSNFSEWGSYKNSYENPWVDVFGPGDEAEAAYWNTQ